jgi:hypothetical protein
LPVRIVSFGGRSVAIEYDIPEGREITDFLYRDIQPADSAEPHVALTISRLDDRQLALSRGEERLYEGDSKASLASVLVGETIRHLTDKCDRGLTIHAAALCRDDAGIIMPGKSGAGKSSLTTWLLGRGFSYLTDELVFIPRNSLLIEAFTRPINIKSHGVGAISRYFDFEANKSNTLASRHVTMIPHRLLNPHTASGPAELSMIMFPHHQLDSELDLQRLTKAQVGLSLMECLVNARNLDGHGFQEATRVAREVPAYSLTYGRFDQLENELDVLLP